MPAGSDKLIEFDPPGAIGLPSDGAVVLFRFNEDSLTVPPKDAAGKLSDLGIDTGLVAPSLASGAVGRGRAFEPVSGTGLVGSDLESGDTLLTRDVAVQVILSIDVDHLDAFGTGAIVARGKGTSSAEYVSYALEVTVVDAPSRLCSIRWMWHDTAGAVKNQTAVQFTAPAGFTMLTATRRWVSPTSVVLRYYIGDTLLGEVASSDGSIGGGTTGTFQVGTRFLSTVYARFFAGTLDELLVLDHEITQEEIESTWLRITVEQPRGHRMFLEMHDRGFPLPSDPSSDAQLDARMVGHALGYASAQAENLRNNMLPGRSYGTVLEQWEEVVRVTPQPAQSIDQRRARVVARMRQRRGVSIPGIGDALVDLLGGASVDDLEFLAFSTTIEDNFADLDLLRWDVTPAASWVLAGGGLRSSPAAGTYLFNGSTQNWRYAQMTIGGNGKQAHLLSRVVMTTPQANLECGLFAANRGTRDFLLLGLRDDAGTFKIVTESFVAGVSQGVVVRATLGGNPAALWLHLYQTTTDGIWKSAWSTTSGTAGFTISADITHPTVAHWGGLYTRSTAAIAGAGQVDADDFVARMPFCKRPMVAYVLLDEALGFTPDAIGARSVIAAIKHAFTHATFITQRVFLAGDPASGAGLGPTGGY